MRAASLPRRISLSSTNVVVQQGRGVHELHRGRKLDVSGAAVTRKLRHGEGEHRAQPLAAG